ncbi:sugar transporter ERD6-like 5 isoform X2 [Quercus lobata]|uniref:sugar transporter ERD6-like 5 isoform X2 n=1 Tax=Quercus lobata TaxID=97700 RepID=UPI001248CA3B|nr:sugar transporter ERD6-like 5 isoform X2 [Quercus lobata]
MEDEELTKSLLVAQQPGNIRIISNGVGSNDTGASASASASASGVTVVLLLSAFVTACSAFTGGFVVGYSAPAESGIIADLGLSTAEYSVFGSIMTIGGMIGAVISGKLADIIGRKNTMWILDMFYIMGWLAIYFAKAHSRTGTGEPNGAWLLDLGRLSLGFGFGLTCYAAPIYLSEITPKNLRGGFTSVTMAMIPFSLTVAYLIGSVVNWRALALIGAIPCLFLLFGLFFIPESPRWLAKIGREKEFEAALQCLRGKNVNTSEEAADIKNYTENIQQISEDKILHLFQQKYAYQLIVGIGLMVLQQFGGLNGFAFYMDEIFELAGVPSIIGFIVVSIPEIPAIALGSILIEKFGRRTLLMISATGECLGCVLTGLSFLLQSLNWWTEATPTLVLSGILVFKVSYSLGVGAIPWIIISEIFPINVKGSAGSICNLVNWFCSWLVSYTFNFLVEWSSAGTFFLYASMSGLGVLFSATLVPETRRRTLEGIQASLIHTLQ